MAKTYDLYLGGDRTANPGTRMFPSSPYNPLAEIKAADHKTPNSYSLTRVVDVANPTASPATGTVGSAALRDWFNYQASIGSPVAVNDVLPLVALPNGQLFDGLFWAVETPVTGFTFSLGFGRIGNGSYVSGATSLPAGTIGTLLVTGQSASARASGFVDANGTAITADTAAAFKSMWIGGSINATTGIALGDVICLRVDAIPAGTGAAALGNLRLQISPLVREFTRGQF